MAGNNRYISGQTNIIRAPVRGQTTVEAGDLMWLWDLGATTTGQGGLTTGRNTDYYAYPMGAMSSSCTGLRRHNFIKGENWFLGVAMDGSGSGVTEDISVATSGQFRYPQTTTANASGSSPTTVGMTVSITSRPASQAVQPGGTAAGTSTYIGICSKTESATSFIDFFLRTDFGPAAIVT